MRTYLLLIFFLLSACALRSGEAANVQDIGTFEVLSADARSLILIKEVEVSKTVMHPVPFTGITFKENFLVVVDFLEEKLSSNGTIGNKSGSEIAVYSEIMSKEELDYIKADHPRVSLEAKKLREKRTGFRVINGNFNYEKDKGVVRLHLMYERFYNSGKLQPFPLTLISKAEPKGRSQ